MVRAKYHQHEKQSKPSRGRLLGPILRFLGWWAGIFGFIGPFSVCPFCGQPGCGMGAASAGLLGGLAAALMTLPKYLRKAIARHRSDSSEKTI